MMLSRRTAWLATLLIVVFGCAYAWPQTIEREARRRAARTQPPPRPTQRTKPPAVRPGGTAQPPRIQRTVPESTRFTRARPLVELEIGTAKDVWGTVVIELHQQRVPATVRNFLRYVDEGFYNGTIFHRVLPDFIIQGGGYTGIGEIKTEGMHGAVRNESRIAEKNTRGTIAMARKQDPHSAQCQFFINVADNNRLDCAGSTRYGHCVFGRIISGMEIIDRIKSMPTTVGPEAQRRFESYKARGYDVQAPEKSQPITPVMIISARRIERSEYEQRHKHGEEGDGVVPVPVQGHLEQPEFPPPEGDPNLEEPESPADEPLPPEDEPLPEEPADGDE
ncbi:MAG: peptidylprolyl isomerase [Phycisphaerae bacterium]|jgi:cyclophilin family peptidyl-prolyl cis-trans isomerase